MKLNNKGFAISSIMYIILVLGVILMVVTLALLGSRKLVLDKLKGEAISSIYNEEIIEPTKICTAVTDENVTTGNIPSGSYLAGDEYICQVNDDESYHFFVVSTSGDNVNLMLDRNIASDGSMAESGVTKANSTDGVYSLVEWYKCNCNTTDSYFYMVGPQTAMTILDDATENWTNIPEMVVNYQDEGGYEWVLINSTIYSDTSKEYNLVSFSNTKARLPMVSEITSFDTTNQTNLWMYNYLENYSSVTGDGLQNIDSISGYWTLSSNGSECYAKYVSYKGTISSQYIYSTTGIRPVITIPTSELS